MKNHVVFWFVSLKHQGKKGSLKQNRNHTHMGIYISLRSSLARRGRRPRLLGAWAIFCFSELNSSAASAGMSVFRASLWMVPFFEGTHFMLCLRETKRKPLFFNRNPLFKDTPLCLGVLFGFPKIN